MKSSGKPLRTKSITLRMNESEYQRMVILCDHLALGQSGLIRMLIMMRYSEFLKEQARRKA